MIEIPEVRTPTCQIAESLRRHVVTSMFNVTHPHKFTCYLGDPLTYPALLTGKRICDACGNSAVVDIDLEGGIHIALSDGVNLRLFDAGT